MISTIVSRLILALTLLFSAVVYGYECSGCGAELGWGVYGYCCECSRNLKLDTNPLMYYLFSSESTLNKRDEEKAGNVEKNIKERFEDIIKNIRSSALSIDDKKNILGEDLFDLELSDENETILFE